jgi:hypothetical protein
MEENRAVPKSHLLELLAIIHRDGGHYTSQHGIEKSRIDAIEIIYKLRSDFDDIKRERAALLKTLKTIRDSTYRSAMTLRGVADDALAALEGKP